VIPIARPLRRHIETLPAGDDPGSPLFPDAFKIATGNRDTSALSQQFHDVLVSAGLALARPPKCKAQGKGRESPPGEKRGHFSFIEAHSDPRCSRMPVCPRAVARDIIGHESAAISRHYTHIDEGSKRKALAKLPDVTAHPRTGRESRPKASGLSFPGWKWELADLEADALAFLSMAIALPIHQMTRLEKLSAMEALWVDLSRDEQALESPAWHADALRETERRVAAGEEKPIDWETAKKELRKRFE
jgi:hypothetical protein